MGLCSKCSLSVGCARLWILSPVAQTLVKIVFLDCFSLEDWLAQGSLDPIIRGGKSAKRNVVPARKDCNAEKKDKLLMEWEEWR